jgi:hypothetical protein
MKPTLLVIDILINEYFRLFMLKPILFLRRSLSICLDSYIGSYFMDVR